MTPSKAEPAPTHGQAKNAILFDVDGVLVDVTGSYRKTIQETVAFFAGKEATLQEIQQLKQQGGYNNDWDLTEAILRGRGKAIPRAQLVAKFQQLYWGVEGKDGLIQNEKWLVPKSQLQRLSKKYVLGIVTGRPRAETLFVLKKFQVEQLFNVIVCMEDYPSERSKPDPYPIKLALEKIGASQAIYLGDSVDDILAAKRAGIRAVGVIPPNVAASDLQDALCISGAERVLKDMSMLASLID